MGVRRAFLAFGLVVAVIIGAGCVPAAPPANPWRDDPVLVCIRSHESANLPNPWAAYNPEGPYYGAYQYLQGTWNEAAATVGRHDLVGIPPMEPYVSGDDQDYVTYEIHQLWGDGPWGNRCP